MKIAILVSNVVVAGIGLYNTIISKAFTRNNVHTDIFVFSTSNEINDFTLYKDTQTNYIIGNFSQETYDKLNSYDYVFLNAMPHISDSQEYRDAYYDMVVNKITTKKIFSPHERQLRAFKRQYDERLFSYEFLNAFHRIVTYDVDAEVFKEFRNVVGDSIISKFLPLELPYEFNTDHWKPIEEKDPRITYFGRVNRLKYPDRLIEIAADLHKAGLQAEMRGITRSVGCLAIRNLVYEWDENNKPTSEPSKSIIWFNKAYRDAHGIDKKVKYLTRYTNNTGKVLVFPAYNYNEGIEALSHQAYGCDFFKLKDNIYGYAPEFAIYDMVKAGVIPVMDYDLGLYTKIRKDGQDIGKTLIDTKAGIFLKSDLSNLTDVIEEMTFLFENPEEYEKKRRLCFDVFSAHTNPDNIVKNLIKGFTTENTYTYNKPTFTANSLF